MLNHSWEHRKPIGWATIPLCDNGLYQGLLFHSITDFPFCKLTSSECIQSSVVNFHQNSTWKIWFWPIQRISHGKNGPNLPDFGEKKGSFPDHQIFFDNFQVSSQENRSILVFFSFFLVSYLVYSQIWLTHLMDDHHFSNITELIEKKP
jgi:hypothetical protein